MKTTVQLSKRELATVLAALRLWESARFGYIGVPKDRERALHDIATDNQKFEMLSPKKINSLCERINCAEPLKIIVEVSGGNVDPVHVSHEADVTVYDHDNIEAGDEPPLNLEEETAKLDHAY